MLYFAYGSNMDWQQMRDRCPSAKFVCIAKLKNYRLAVTRKSTKRDCGVVDAVCQANSNVWGVVFQIDERDIGNLDAKEGFVSGRDKNAYIRKEIDVCEDGDETKPITTMSYFVVKKETDVPLPNAEYKRLLVGGAKYWHLPQDYVRELEQIETSE